MESCIRNLPFKESQGKVSLKDPTFSEFPRQKEKEKKKKWDTSHVLLNTSHCPKHHYIITVFRKGLSFFSYALFS